MEGVPRLPPVVVMLELEIEFIPRAADRGPPGGAELIASALGPRGMGPPRIAAGPVGGSLSAFGPVGGPLILSPLIAELLVNPFPFPCPALVQFPVSPPVTPALACLSKRFFSSTSLSRFSRAIASLWALVRNFGYAVKDQKSQMPNKLYNLIKLVTGLIG